MTSGELERTLKSLPLCPATFKEPMECLAVPKLPDGSNWLFEIKFDGYRAIAVKSGGRLNLFSRRRNPFNSQYSLVFEALAGLPDNTVIDGEVIALNESGRPDFNLLQHYRTEASRIHYFVFDFLVYDNRDLTQLSLVERMNIAVADEGGNIVAHVRMDNAWIGSVDISMKKAYTSRAFDIETKDLAKHSQSGGQFFGIHASNNGKIMIFAGGIPLKRDGRVVGAIGVSGGSGDQDHAVAEAGAPAF
jgi:uncharacterized protein GlcG (DUF336 family)